MKFHLPSMSRFFRAFRLLLPFCVAGWLSSAPAGDLLFPNSDFEQGSLNNWTAEGDAFTVQPTRGDNAAARGREKVNLQGSYYIGTFESYDGNSGSPGQVRGDSPTGQLTSIPFVVNADFLTFRVGGGDDLERLVVQLLTEEGRIPLATGMRSETMQTVSFDVSGLRGQAVRLRILDTSSGGWGHLNADDFRWSDRAVGQSRVAMVLPELEDEWSTFPHYQQVGYDQPLRPQFHFTSRMGWLNDPNGMVYYDGEWHMFFQHYAKGNGNGPKSWGTAKSTDLMHWEQMDHVFNPYPNVKLSNGNNHAIWSGSAIVDMNNVLGKQTGDTKTIFATFTATHTNEERKSEFFQVGAYSTDRGRSFTMMQDGRPMIDHMLGLDPGQRDPRVFYHEETQSYMLIMMIGGKDRAVRLWRSDDLMNWEPLFDIPNKSAECIDIYTVAVDGDPENRKWVIADAGSHYEVGDFDGETWSGFGDKDRAGRRLRFEYGDCYYAAQAFNQAPDGRVIHIGWLRSDKPGYRPFLDANMPFTQQMSIPAEITLRTTPEGIRMYRNPVKEIENLYVKTLTFADLSSGDVNAKIRNMDAELMDLTLKFKPAGDFSLNVRGLKVDYLSQTSEFKVENKARVDGIRKAWNRDHPFRDNGIRKIPAAPVKGIVTLRALVDRASLELFVNDGAAAATFVMIPEAENRTLSIEGNAGLNVDLLVINELKSIWE